MGGVGGGGGDDFSEFFARFIAGTDVPDLDHAFAIVGLECIRRPPAPDAAPLLGLNLAEKDGKTLVSSVVADTPAFRAGLMADDEIIALDNRRLRKDDLDKRLKSHKPGDTLTFTLFRRDEVRTISVTLDTPRGDRWSLRRVATPSDDQRRAYQSWLGQPW
ncbi:MAG: PDZ domain-containing protein [Phycisphaerales bacterium]